MKTTYFGLSPYLKSMDIQNQAYRLVQSSGFPVVLGFEYYPVITLGKRASLDEELPGGFQAAQERGFEVVNTDRGGQATLHSPGQLVIYPIVPIQKLGITVRQYVHMLEEATIQWLARHRIQASRKEDAGVFTDKGKIAFIGIRVERGITRHGISININNDLSLFGDIRACGQMVRSVDSLFEQGLEMELKEAFDEWNLFWTSELLKALPNPEK